MIFLDRSPLRLVVLSVRPWPAPTIIFGPPPGSKSSAPFVMSMWEEAPKILIVEDERIVAEDIRATLERFGYRVTATVPSGQEALERVTEEKPSLILMDIVLQGALDGIEVARRLNAQFDIPIVYLTAYTDEFMLQRAKETAPSGYVIKPFDERDLHTTITMALYKHEMTAKLRASKEKYRDLVENLNDVIYALDSDFRLTYISPVITRLTGYRPEELIGKRFVECVTAADREQIEAIFGKTACPVESMNAPIDLRLEREDGQTRWVRISHRAVNEADTLCGYQGVMTDIHQRKLAEEQLRHSLEEKELLLRELQHRVKNNLQLVLSLVEMQALRSTHQAVSNAFENIRSVIHTMALVHSRSYASEQVDKIEMGRFIGQLIPELLKLRRANLQIDYSIETDTIWLGIDKTIPLSLIINELVINAIKHAFIGRSHGHLTVHLRRMNRFIRLQFRDDGIGLELASEDVDVNKDEYVSDPDSVTPRSKGLGLELVKTLVEGQLGGALTIDTDNGTLFTIEFQCAEESLEGNHEPDPHC